MIFRILAEVLLFVTTFVAGAIWWQLRKRAMLVKRIVRDENLLRSLISRDALVNPAPRILPYLQKNQIGYVVNINVLLRADQTSQRIPKIAATIVLLSAFICSYLVVSLYLWINLGVFVLVGLMPITDSARHNACEQVLTLATILHKWRTEDASECDSFVGQTRSLHELYHAVIKAT